MKGKSRYCRLFYDYMDNSWIDIIKLRADDIRKEYSYPDEPIRDDIFKILRKKGILIFYPLCEEKDLDGFHVNRIIDEEIVPFVFINTNNYWDKCIFCAAHELGHIYQIENDIKEHFNQVEISNSLCDDIMNRFAAELLMPEDKFVFVFRNSFSKNIPKKSIIEDQDFLKIIIELMDYFFVPYKAVVKRLFEIGFLTELGRQHYIDYDNRVIETYISEGNYVRPRQINKIKQIDNLEELIRLSQDKSTLSKKRIDEICEVFEISITSTVNDYINNSAKSILNNDLYNAGGSD